MDVEAAAREWNEEGFVVLPAYLSAEVLARAVGQLGMLFPSASEFHEAKDEPRNARFADEFGGIDNFPFAGVELSLLAVHHDLIALAAALLGDNRLRVCSIEAWAKYTGAANYEQAHHRDYLSQTIVAPSRDRRYQQVEMFVYLEDVSASLGPTCLVPRRHTRALPAIPNWFPRVANAAADENHPSWVSPLGHPELYEAEVAAVGPAGTVVAYANDTLHRGTGMTAPGGARYTLHVTLRPEGADWISRHSWQQQSNTSRWHELVVRCTPEQLSLFGFPPPGHPYWTNDTIEATAARYPGLDLAPWRAP